MFVNISRIFGALSSLGLKIGASIVIRCCRSTHRSTQDQGAEILLDVILRSSRTLTRLVSYVHLEYSLLAFLEKVSDLTCPYSIGFVGLWITADHPLAHYGALSSSPCSLTSKVSSGRRQLSQPCPPHLAHSRAR